MDPATVGGRTFYIDYTGEGTYALAQLCTSVTYDAQENVTGAVHPDDLNTTDPGSVDTPWCITGQSYTINSLGEIVLEQHWDGLGDPRMR